MLGSRLCKYNHFSGERKIFVHFTIYGEIGRAYTDHYVNIWNQYRKLENCNTMDNATCRELVSFTWLGGKQVCDRDGQTKTFCTVYSCFPVIWVKKQFISCITRLTGKVVRRVTLTVTLVTMEGLCNKCWVIWHATDFLQLADYHSTSLNLYLAPTGRHKLLAFDFSFFPAHLILNKYK